MSSIVAKCQAMQIGVLIAGLILLVIVIYNWWNDYSNQCLASCRSTNQSCRAACPPVDSVAASSSGSVAASATVTPATSKFTGSKGQLTDHEIQSNFLSYREDDGDMDYYQQFAAPGSGGTMAYDPARESLEQSVYDSHKEFVEDSYISTTGANASDSLRTDTNDINKRVGLRMIDYSSVNSEDETVRITSSEYPEQMGNRNTSFII